MITSYLSPKILDTLKTLRVLLYFNGKMKKYNGTPIIRYIVCFLLRINARFSHDIATVLDWCIPATPIINKSMFSTKKAFLQKSAKFYDPINTEMWLVNQKVNFHKNL